MPKRTDIHSVLIIGAGFQSLSGRAARNWVFRHPSLRSLKEITASCSSNSNPATIMTDPEFAERTYLEPITPEAVEKIIVREKAEMERLGTRGKLVLLPTLGGQTALNTAMALHKNGALDRHHVEMIGAKPEAIHKGEDRLAFKDLMLQIGLDVPISGVAHNLDEVRAVADTVGPSRASCARVTPGGTGSIRLQSGEFSKSPSAASNSRPSAKSSLRNRCSAGRNTKWKSCATRPTIA